MIIEHASPPSSISVNTIRNKMDRLASGLRLSPVSSLYGLKHWRSLNPMKCALAPGRRRVMATRKEVMGPSVDPQLLFPFPPRRRCFIGLHFTSPKVTVTLEKRLLLDLARGMHRRRTGLPLPIAMVHASHRTEVGQITPFVTVPQTPRFRRVAGCRKLLRLPSIEQ